MVVDGKRERLRAFTRQDGPEFVDVGVRIECVHVATVECRLLVQGVGNCYASRPRMAADFSASEPTVARPTMTQKRTVLSVTDPE